MVADVHRDGKPDGVGDTWGHLRLFERVGGGSSGDVFRAWDTQLDREVALKLLPAATSSRAVGDAVSPFSMVLGDAQSIIREGRLLAKVRHPSVVTIHGAAQIGDRVGLWMEFIHGYTLEELIQKNGRFGSADVTAIGIEVCRAVSAVHDAWLLHRDIKAHNVMRANDGRIVLMDFGTGRELNAVVTPGVAGTPLYLAPELLRQQAATVQSDVYSLGVLLYHLASGAYPVRGETVPGLLAAHDRGERVPLRVAAPDSSARLARIVERSIDPKPEERFQTAAALGEALVKLQRRERRKPLLAAAGIVAGIAAIGVAAWASRPKPPAANAPITMAMPGTLPTQSPDPVRFKGIRQSVRVEPFKNASGQPAHSWLSATLSELVRRDIRATGHFRWLPDDISAAKAQLNGVLGSAGSPWRNSADFPDFRFTPPNAPTDFVVSGDYRVSGSPEQLQVTITINDIVRTQARVLAEERGPATNVVELVAQAAAPLRDALGVPPLSDHQMRALVNSRPANAASARAYVEGLAKSPRDAVELMQQAVTADPRFAPAFAILAEGWWLRGERDQAIQTAAKATALSAGLSPEERVLIAIRTGGISQNRTWSVEPRFLVPAVRKIFTDFPDTRFYGYSAARQVLLAQEMRRSGPDHALPLIDATKRLPGASEDPDLLLLEATAARRSGDESRAQIALKRASQIAQTRRDPDLLGAVRYTEALHAARYGEAVQALAFAEEALRYVLDGKQRSNVLVTRSAIDGIVDRQDTFAWVRPAYEKLIDDAVKSGDATKALVLRRSLAHALSAHDALSQSRAAWEALEQRAGTGEPADGLMASLELGRVLHRLGELTAARKQHDAALAASVARQDADAEQRARLSLARILYDMGELPAARHHADQAAAPSVSALVKLAEGDPVSARRLLVDARLARASPEPCTTELTTAALVVVLETELPDEVLAQAKSAATCASGTLRPDAKAAADVVTALAGLRKHRFEDNSSALASVEPRLKTTEDRLLRLWGGIAAARLRASSRKPADVTAATRRLNGVVKDATAIGAVAIAFDARLALGEIEYKVGDVAAGRTHLASLERDATAKGFLDIVRKIAVIRKGP